MHRADIKAALQRAGFTQTSIAAAVGVKQPSVSCVIAGNTKSRRIAKAIAKATGLSLAELWPGKYRELDLSGTEPIRKLLTRSPS